MQITKPKRETLLDRSAAERLRDGILEDFRRAETRLVQGVIKLKRFIEGQGWLALGYRTMTEWRQAEMSFSEFYNLRAAMKALISGQVPAEELEKMKLTNLQTMVRVLPEKEWADPKWQKAAIEMPVAEFEKKARDHAGEKGYHAEEYRTRGFSAPESVVADWDLAIKDGGVAHTVDGAENLAERVQVIVQEYLDSPSDAPGRSKRQRHAEIAGEFGKS